MKRETGFTLLEVLVALTILAVGVSLTLSLISGSLGSIRKVRMHTLAIEHAQVVMELALLDDSIKAATTRRGDFEDGTRWAVVISEVEMPIPETVMTGTQTAQMPIKVLSYDVEVMEPNSATPDFQLRTLKVVNALDANGLARVPQ